jgi:uncharacterized membrane-anchored protein YitT (DUF2179 family)
VLQQREKYLASAIFSALVAGLGQIVKGEAKKGLKIMIWFYMGMPMLIMATFLLNPYLFLVTLAAFVVIYPAFWAYNIMDAYSKQIYNRR